MDDWNPNYEVVVEKKPLGVLANFKDAPKVQSIIIKKLKITEKLKSSYWSSPNELKMFFEESVNVTIDFNEKVAIVEKVSPRVILKRFNDLHLNNPKKAWTYISDIFALCLMYLAISAIFMVKGKKGIKGRGGILTIIGFIIPLVSILIFT